MKNILLLGLSVLVLMGCETGQTDVKLTENQINKISGFEDCVSYVGQIGGWRSVIVRCPNSTVNNTVYSNKQYITSTVIDQTNTSMADREKARKEFEEQLKRVEQATADLETAKKAYENLIRK